MTIDAEIATLSNEDHDGGRSVPSMGQASRDFSAVVITGFYYFCSFRELVRSRRQASGTVLVDTIPPPGFSLAENLNARKKSRSLPASGVISSAGPGH
jgi:hypothetical protein